MHRERGHQHAGRSSGRGEGAEPHDGCPAVDQAHGGELSFDLDVGDPRGDVSVGGLRQALGGCLSALTGRSARSSANAVLQLGAAEGGLRVAHAITDLQLELDDRGAQKVEITRQRTLLRRADRSRRQRRRSLAFRPSERQLGVAAAHCHGDAKVDDGGRVHGDVGPELGAAEHRCQRGELVDRRGATPQSILRTPRAGEELGRDEVAATAGGGTEPVPRGRKVAFGGVHVDAVGGQLGGENAGVVGSGGQPGILGGGDDGVDEGDVGAIGHSGALVGFDPQRRRGRPPAGASLRLEQGLRLTGSSGGALHVAGEQRSAGDQHEHLGDIDVVALRAHALYGPFGEVQGLVRQPGCDQRFGAIRIHGGTADAEGLVALLSVVEAPERLDEIAAPGRQPGQVVVHVGGRLRPALGLIEIESAPRVRLRRLDLAGPSEQHATIRQEVGDDRAVCGVGGGLEGGGERGQRISMLAERGATASPAGSSRPPCRRRRGVRRPASPAPANVRSPRSTRGCRRGTSTPGLPDLGRRV